MYSSWHVMTPVGWRKIGLGDTSGGGGNYTQNRLTSSTHIRPHDNFPFPGVVTVLLRCWTNLGDGLCWLSRNVQKGPFVAFVVVDDVVRAIIFNVTKYLSLLTGA